MNKNNFCVIMAGGVGSRFWPLSRQSKPKQFLDILGTGRTLIQATYDRFLKICPKENILIVTHQNYKTLVLEQLPDITENQILLEPMRRNTAPCIAYASFKIQKKNKDANIIVAPSDHLILNEAEFIRVAETGLDFISKNPTLLTIGIHPSRPETGYGYIQIMDKKNAFQIEHLHKVKTFTEKPNLDMAKIFLASGDFYWNAGIFMWSVKTIIQAFDDYLPEVKDLFMSKYQAYDTHAEEEAINNIYPQCKSISIDYAVMEKAKNVYVLCADFGWSDLGTWGSIYEQHSKDADENAVPNHNLMAYNTHNCIINVPKNKLIVTQGLDNYIVVDTDDVILICPKDDEQRIRQIVNDLEMKKEDHYL